MEQKLKDWFEWFNSQPYNQELYGYVEGLSYYEQLCRLTKMVVQLAEWYKTIPDNQAEVNQRFQTLENTLRGEITALDNKTQTKFNSIDDLISANSREISTIKGTITSLQRSVETTSNKVNVIEGQVGNINTQITTINNKNTQQDTSIQKLETSVTQINAKDKTQDTSIQALETKNSQQDKAIQDLKTQVESVDLSGVTTRLTEVENKNKTQDSQIQDLTGGVEANTRSIKTLTDWKTSSSADILKLKNTQIKDITSSDGTVNITKQTSADGNTYNLTVTSTGGGSGSGVTLNQPLSTINAQKKNVVVGLSNGTSSSDTSSITINANSVGVDETGLEKTTPKPLFKLDTTNFTAVNDNGTPKISLKGLPVVPSITHLATKEELKTNVDTINGKISTNTTLINNNKKASCKDITSTDKTVTITKQTSESGTTYNLSVPAQAPSGVSLTANLKKFNDTPTTAITSTVGNTSISTDTLKGSYIAYANGAQSTKNYSLFKIDGSLVLSDDLGTAKLSVKSPFNASNYYDKGTIDSKLSQYVTNSALTTKLGSYVTTSSLNNTLSSYSNNTQLNQKLANYYTKTDANGAFEYKGTSYSKTDADKKFATQTALANEKATLLQKITSVESANTQNETEIANVSGRVETIGTNVQNLERDKVDKTQLGDQVTFRLSGTTLEITSK